MKILATILAARLLNYIKSLVHEDQSGFMPGSTTRLNLRRTHNWLMKVMDRDTPHIFLSLDAEKTFDAVHWPFLECTLPKFGIGPKFRGWVALLYNMPTSTVRVNRVRSTAFPIGQRMRQGCPLSPLLFGLTLESLACGVQRHPEIWAF